jgi:hypothetical protein
LRKPSSQDSGTDPFEVFQGDFKTDGKQKKNDPYLGEEFHLADIVNKPKSMRTEENSGNEEPYDGRDSELMEDKNNGSRDSKDDDQCFQKFKSHGFSSETIIT